MTQMPTLSPFSTPNPIGTIFGSVGDGMWLAATSSPWVGAVVCLLIVSVMARVYRAVRWAPIAAAGLDPLRRFIGVDRAAILSRAGNRCERHSLLFGRCKETEKLHADHVHPHSKGGSTTVANAQVLCSRHNTWAFATVVLPPFECGWTWSACSFSVSLHRPNSKLCLSHRLPARERIAARSTPMNRRKGSSPAAAIGAHLTAR